MHQLLALWLRLPFLAHVHHETTLRALPLGGLLFQVTVKQVLLHVEVIVGEALSCVLMFKSSCIRLVGLLHGKESGRMGTGGGGLYFIQGR